MPRRFRCQANQHLGGLSGCKASWQEDKITGTTAVDFMEDFLLGKRAVEKGGIVDMVRGIL